VPAEQGVWLHDGNGLAPRGEQRGAEEEFQSIGYLEPGTLLASTKDVDLVSKRCVLDDQVTSGAAHVDSHSFYGHCAQNGNCSHGMAKEHGG
jgi:hypothetical protein